jgi:peptide/nickel transport system permease protein
MTGQVVSVLATWRAHPLGQAAGRFAGMPLAMAGLFVLLAVVLMVVFYRLVLGVDPNAIDLTSLNAPPDAVHWLGTDGVGRDVLARVLEGGRISLTVACSAVGVSMLIGFLIGAVAALGGALANVAAMRVVDLAMTLPPVVLLLVLASVAGQGIAPTILVISLLSWPVLARMVRARLLELREREFVIASRGMGGGVWHLMIRHALPNCVDILIVYATLQFAQAILAEAGLSFLGMGIPPPAASWGNMLNGARSSVVLEHYPWQWLSPGIALLLTELAINFVGDGLSTALNPRSEAG